MKNYVLLGPPGAGKGTQGAILAEQYRLRHISTGDLLRSEIAAGTELGKIAKGIIEAGNFVPDQVVEDMIEDKLRNSSEYTGILLDGFPRNEAQARVLDEMLARMDQRVDACISIVIPDGTVFERIAHRAHIEGRSDDARPEVIQNRIATYHKQTEVLISYYRDKGCYVEVDGLGSIEDVHTRICEAIDLI